MDRMHFEDMEPGAVAAYGGYEVTKAEILAYASEFDPQPFHLDEVAAKATMLGGLAASGWHTASINMRMVYDGFLKNAAAMGGPGIEELKWLRPVRPGDRLSGRIRILDKRESRSRPEMGLVRFFVDVLNQADDVVMTQQMAIMVARRDAAQVPRPAAGDSVRLPQKPLPQGQTPSPFCLYFDDVEPGQSGEMGTETFTAANIIRFGRAYDPQPFHTDEAAARESQFGGLVASGWHTGSCWMKHAIRHRNKLLAEFAARNEAAPELGPSPGFRDLKWLHPVRPDDAITYTMTVRDKRRTSRPGWGLVFGRNSGVNQHGRLVFEYQSSVFWPMRP